MLCTEPPFDDVNVRKALHIGTNINALMELNFADELPRHFYPIHFQNPAYIPENELPADIAELYEYSSTDAIQLLTDAGYPGGLTIDLYTDDSTTSQNNAALLMSQWEDIGVTANIIVNDRATHDDLAFNRSYHGALLSSFGSPNPDIMLYRHSYTEGYANFAGYSNPEFDTVVEALVGELDPTVQLPLIEEAQLMLLRDVVYIPIYPVVSAHFWWPWLKNYNGEVTITDGSPHSLIGWIWVDEGMKQGMGF
jgi:peptide/nickel transport system substrate-binding protein